MTVWMLMPVISDPFAELSTITIGFGLLIDLLNNFVHCFSDKSFNLRKYFRRHISSHVIPQQGFTDVASAALISKDKSKGIDIERFLFSVIQTGIASRAKYGCKSGIPAKKCPRGPQQVHGDKHHSGIYKHIPENILHEFILELTDSCSIEIDFSYFINREILGKIVQDVISYFLARDVIRIVA